MEKREINILLLGETGVGKSTWINGFVNYLKYDTLSEAENGENVCLIPISFVTMEIDGDDYVEKKMMWGPSDHNEADAVGQSCTQMPKSYVFKTADATIRLIDTPGIGDTRGIKQDKENLQFIMSHISNYDSLHGIVILLKPNNARLNVMFTFCVKELLAHLHTDACRNILICFTNARSTQYKPGGTLPALKKLLETDKIPLQIKPSLTYCVDNESVRFLATVKSGGSVADIGRATFEESWKASVVEIKRMMEYISSRPPHMIQNTISLNSVRKLILDISRPMAEIGELIQRTIDAIDMKKKEDIELTSSQHELEEQLFIPSHDLVLKQLDYPTTVCSSSKCVETVDAGGESKRHYIKRCHESCGLTAGTNVIGAAELQHCSAMTNGKCDNCGCPWHAHMHITYETRIVAVKKKDLDVQYKIDNKEELKKQIEEYRLKLQTEADDLEKVKQEITKVGAACACFLKKNAIVPYNDALISYLDHIVEIEEKKLKDYPGSDEKLKSLRKLREVYEEELKTLQNAVAQGLGDVSVMNPNEIEREIQKLYALPKYGDKFREMIQTADANNKKATKHSETVVNMGKKTFFQRAGDAVCVAATSVKTFVTGDKLDNRKKLKK